eukprot:TRINITY_DN40785_c0_g1_i1.p1 TRINITY_DN40785_c0_g1~~TRINITY_DN40785_c0_g1_i1.p1  ORF type:complete len:193 (-),score=16.46 TRINITY_DN40785_c0_g1_i1:110-688(-)
MQYPHPADIPLPTSLLTPSSGPAAAYLAEKSLIGSVSGEDEDAGEEVESAQGSGSAQGSHMQLGGGPDVWPAKPRKKVYELLASEPMNVQTLLRWLAALLLTYRGRIATTSDVGAALPDAWRQWLRDRELRLATIVRCFKDDFDVRGEHKQMTVMYRHSRVLPQYNWLAARSWASSASSSTMTMQGSRQPHL